MSKRTVSAVERFVTHARAVATAPAGFTPSAVRIAAELVDADDRGDSLEAKALVLEIDRMVGLGTWSVAR